ncbi:peptidoglycan-binding protein [Streptomyces sp. LP05-1]|uniref:Peptidoglycan-binding protein n=1 Tax=Streptomyces pyxinae TaxID=2970734 RepID=A0ABT2CMF7_9ACTN|nr:peptidoglycan-binding domain-containing protein [Streptomyces sp. LP05-1]MCS0638520.1 peptidoglycan-binding protein [Streptomyces sp. LP05-1]
MTETVRRTDGADEDAGMGAGVGAAAPPPPRRRRTALIASAVVVVAAVAVAGALGLGGGGDEGPAVPPRSGSLVPVTRETLTERTTVDGELGYGTELPLPVKAVGTVTWLPEQGSTVGRGGTLLRVDDRPVILLYGTLPMYRDLGPAPRESGSDDKSAGGRGTGESGGQRTEGSGKPPDPAGTPAAGGTGDGAGKGGGGRTGDGAATGGGAGTGESAGTGDGGSTGAATAPQDPKGADVMQFESNLAALGYTGFTVDEEFTAGTARAVKRWQKSLGLPQTGTVGAGDVIYASGTVRIGQAGGRPGSAVGENTLGYTGTSRQVIVDASAADAAWAVRGAAVTVELPDGRAVEGTVASIGKRAAAPEGGGEGGTGQAGATVPVTVALRDQRAAGELESGPVTVEYVGRQARNVLSVPVSALVALAEGGHGLETAEGRFVAVRTGLFTEGRVEVSGPAIREGMKVRIPE